MGKQIHLKKVERLFEQSPVADFNSVVRLVGNKGYTKLLISNLLKQKKIQKVGKGVYTKYDERTLAVFAFKPAYLGLQSALSYHGLWEQETVPIILTIRKVRRGVRRIMGGNVVVRTIDPKYFFGFEFVKEGEFYLPYSDVEKTVIDLVVFGISMDDALLRVVRKKVNLVKLHEYLKRYSLVLRVRVEKVLGVRERK